MLLGGDLGFLARVVVASLVVIFAPVVGFVVRRKWRRSVARREEIKRLLVLASEETARAELQAEAETDFGYGYEGYNGYGYRSSVAEEAAGEAEAESVAAAEVELPVEVQVQASSAASVQAPRQCEVCRSPTTTRCARCKAVRYCSSKCQIIHWRQGHKDECCPFTFNHQSHDMGGTPPKLLKAKQNEIHKNGIEIGGSHPAKAVEISSGEASDSSLSNSSDWEENEVEVSTDKKERNSKSKLMAPELNEVSGLNSSGSSIDASASTLHKHSTSRSVGIPGKTETNCANADQTKPFLEHSNLVSSSVNYEPVPIDVDSLRGSSTSSASSVDGRNESSFSEPSTPSSGFWEATVNLTRSRIDAFDDVAHSCCDESVHLDDVLSSQLSSCCSSELLGSVRPQRDMPGTCDKKVLSDDPRISMREEKPSTNGSSAPVKENKGSLEFHRSSASSLKRSDHVDFSDFSIKKVSNSREPGELALSKDDKAGSLPFSNPEKINCKISGQISISQEPKPVELKSLSSQASSENLSSNHGRHAFQNVKPVKAVSAHEPPACSSDFLGHTQNTRNSSKPSVWKVVDQLRASKITRLTSLGGVGENVGKYYSKGLFPYDLFVMLYNWNKVELIPCGLMNCGNSCYANVVLQCLAFTPPLTAYFLQGLHSKACKKRDWCFTCEFESFVLKAKDGNSPISPSRIISQLQNIGTNLGNGREEDAHEFLRCAIDTMQSGCLEEAGISASGSLEDTTLLGLTFGGYLRSKIECMRCGGKSERHEKMMDLTVEIEGNIGTLEEALRQFTRTETLDGENKYQCSRCKSYEKAKKKLRVLEAPNVLTIALKRFQSGKFGKLNKTINFPEILDLAPYMSGTSDKSPIYRLYGVIVHLDIMNTAFSGHYVCYVKNTQNKWFKIDDSMVKGVELESVLTKGSYMLLYARCSPRAPRLIRSTLVPRDLRKSKHPDSGARYHARGRWDVPANDSSHNQTSDGCFSPNYSSFQPFHTIWEEDYSSDKSSSLFSEVNSCSTDSSNRDSMCSDDLFDQILGGDTRVFWGSSWRNSSDSEASSSSSSPSPLYARHSLHDSEAYSSKYPVATDHCIDTAVPAFDDRLRFRGHSEVEVTGSRGSTPFLCPDSDKGSNSFLCPDSTKSCRKLGSSSCREIGSGKLGRPNPFENLKSSVTFRRSIREKD